MEQWSNGAVKQWSSGAVDYKNEKIEEVSLLGRGVDVLLFGFSQYN